MLCVYTYSRSNLSLREDFVKEKGKSRSSLRCVPFVWLPKSNTHTYTDERVRNEVIFITLPNIAFFRYFSRVFGKRALWEEDGNKQNI